MEQTSAEAGLNYKYSGKVEQSVHPSSLDTLQNLRKPLHLSIDLQLKETELHRKEPSRNRSSSFPFHPN